MSSYTSYESELEIHKSGDTSWVTFIAKTLDTINVVTKGQTLETGRISDKLKTQFYITLHYITNLHLNIDQ